jgi:hypothetical protein
MTNHVFTFITATTTNGTIQLDLDNYKDIN